MMEKEWHSLSFDDLQIETRDGQHHFQVEVIFGGVDPQAVQVELFAAAPEGHAWRQAMTRGDRLPDGGGLPVYRPSAGDGPASDFTLASHPLLSRRRRAAGNTFNFVAALITTGGT